MRIVLPLAALLAGCSLLTPALRTLELDASPAPIRFRALAKTTLLVDPKVGQGELAKFGNFIAWSAREVPAARLMVWDDEAAWNAAADGAMVGDSVLTHERGEYMKDHAPPAVEQFAIFAPDGSVLYKRDFLDWPASGAGG